MPRASEILYYALHVQELRSIIQWKVWHNAVHERDESKESPSLRQCFFYLDMTSRSFSAVIKELHPELLVPVCLFYLILRGLDTIEDDMTIPLPTKEPLLRDFDNILEQPGWTFTGNGPNEKDRELLVHFDCVVEEFGKVKEEYRVIIKDITKKMGNGMADYANNAEHNINGVNTIKDYELYCHYVAGLVGEGLTRLFVESKLANPMLMQRPELSESMGQFLQQVNITRDIREDLDDGRRFWPKEIWSKHVEKFEDLFSSDNPAHRAAALNCSSEMVLTALTRAPDCLFYLAGLRDQSVFNFCAIPQSMAIATLDLCFRNPEIFEKNVKITKGQACRLMIESTQNLQVVCEVFKRFARSIAKKNDPRDPNFLKISVACGKIEQFVESIFPSQTATQKVVAEVGRPVKTPEQEREEAEQAREQRQDMLYVGIAVGATLLLVSLFMFGIAWMAGARFDIAIDQLKQGIFNSPKAGSPEAQQVVQSYEHGEL
ncbi:farnesyl-diphosphate farnesyltransferase [Saccharata proteae CBS 121410]|uniref:Squalene synthase n=1 Tax=Saccharata proteae CBS 121410 TaxID=1314787 RepID=A0A9P4LWH3_9PEZI|nr:farnesyl-diphosphate farnesyltransferase [Saccharata proteae CBS 121410]